MIYYVMLHYLTLYYISLHYISLSLYVYVIEYVILVYYMIFAKAPPNSLFGDQPQNELVIRIQPNEAIYYKARRPSKFAVYG